MLANLESSAVATGLEKVSFHPNPKEDQCQRMVKLPNNWAHFTRLQQYVNQEIPDVQAEFRKGRGTRERAREIQRNISFCLTAYAKAFDCVGHSQLWKILKEMGIPDHFTCLLRNLYTGQKETVRTGHGTTDWFKIGKGVQRGCIYFILFTEHTMQNVRLDESTSWNHKITGRNIKKLRYGDDTTLMA